MGLPHWINRFIYVDQQILMTAVLVIITGMGYAHAPQPVTTPKFSFDHRTILRPNEI